MVWRLLTAWLTLPLLLAVPLPALAADPLVVSVWGGNWKDTVEKVVAKPFTARTGIPVEFEVGATLDRLAKARVSKAAPLVDITFTTSHVGRVFWRVTLPLSTPGIVSGALVVFAWTFSAFVTPELLGGGRVKMIANVVKDLALDAFNWPGSAAFAVVALAVTLAILVLMMRLLGREVA